jgi:osmotically-inducible protein OsmY
MRSTVRLAQGLAVAAILAACASTVEQQAKDVIDDAHITEQVKAALALEPALKEATLVNVDTYLGVVSLAGFVDTPEVARRAAEVAGAVGGVQSVRNNIGVRSGH